MGLRNKKVLITCGPTWVALDPVRVISNLSTGALGQMLAQRLIRAGAKVTLLEGPVHCSLKNSKVKIRKFVFFNELAFLFQAELKKKYDAVIHAAAAADYRPRSPSKKKLPSQRPTLTVRFVPTPKLIELVKKFSPAAFLVGFKLETARDKRALIRAARRLTEDAGCDLVVANTVAPKYDGLIVDKNNKILAHAASKTILAKQLTQILKRHL